MISANDKNTKKQYEGKLNPKLASAVPNNSGIVFSNDDKRNRNKRVLAFNIAIILTIILDIAVAIKMVLVGFNLIALIVLVGGILVETALYIIISAPKFGYDYLSGAAKFFVLFLIIAPVGMLINAIAFKGALDFVVMVCRVIVFILIALFYSFVWLDRKPRVAISLILSLMFVSSAALCYTFRADFSAIEDYSVRCYYIVNEDKSATITGFADYSISTTYNVPSKINGLDVTGIGDGAFGSININELAIPDSVQSISASAFTNVACIENVVLYSDSVQDVSFINDCPGLKAIYMPNGIENIKEVCESVDGTNSDVKIIVPRDKIDSYLKVIYEETTYNGEILAPAIGKDEYYISLDAGNNVYIPLIIGTIDEIKQKISEYDSTSFEKVFDGRTYKQAGWYSDAAFSGDAYDYSNISSLLNPENYNENSLARGISVYLKWLPIYNVKYDNSDWAFDGNQDISSFDFTVEDSDILLLNPIKDGYTFMGWYNNANFTGGAITTIETSAATDVNIYPKFLKNYGLNFELKGGEFAGEFPEYYHTEMSFDLPVPTRTAYDFKGWSDGEDAIYKITAGMEGGKALTAVWEPTVYNITFNANGGNLIESIQYTIESNDVSLLEVTSERAGFSFGAWERNGSSVSLIPSGSYGNIELKAQWMLCAPETTISNSATDSIVYGTGEAVLLWDSEYDGITYVYQWQKQVGEEWSNIAGNTKKLQLDKVLETGKYRVYVTASYENQVQHTYSNEIYINIVKADYDMSEVSFIDGSRIYNGSVQQLAVSGTLPTGADNIQVTVSYSGSATNVLDGTQTITATFATTSTNYNVPKPKTAQLTIMPKSADVVWVKAETYIYSGNILTIPTAKIVGVDGDINLAVIEQDGKQFDIAEEYQFVASTTNTNYTLANTICKITVHKANYDMSGVSFMNASKVYTGYAQQLTVSGTLPTGADDIQVTVSYSGSATNVSDGSQTITATFATTSTNYNVPKPKTARLTITPKSSDVMWQAENKYTYQGSMFVLPTATFNEVENGVIQADVSEKNNKQFF